MTVVKRQAQSPAGVSSEVEVLKALKSLFEHHKALDEKVRERLRVTLEKVSTLEEELGHANEELNKSRQMQLQQQQQIENMQMTSKLRYNNNNNSSEDGTQTKDDAASARMANGTSKSDSTQSEDAARVRELQALIEKQSNEMLTIRNRSAELSAKLKDYEDRIVKADKDVAQLKEENARFSRDLKEHNAQKEDQEERIATLEKRYLSAQRESTNVHDMNEKLERELINKESALRNAEDKLNSLKEQIQILSESKGGKKIRKLRKFLIGENGQKGDGNGDADSGEDDDEEQDLERKRSMEDKLMRLETQLEEKAAELSRARQREKMNEDHNQRLSATVDKLLAESNERLQLHLKERMSALEDKNTLTQELERVRKLLDDTQMDKSKILQDLNKTRLEVESLLSQQNSLTASITATRPGSSSSRYHSNYLINSSALSSPLSEATSQSTAKMVGVAHSPSNAENVELGREAMSSRNAVSPKEWERDNSIRGPPSAKQSPQAQLPGQQQQQLVGAGGGNESPQMANARINYMTGQAGPYKDTEDVELHRDLECYSRMTGESDEGDHPLDHLMSGQQHMPQLVMSSAPHTDPQTLAIMLQEQLDAINNEIRLIQEEKQNPDHPGGGGGGGGRGVSMLDAQADSIDSSMNNYLNAIMPEQMATFSGNYGVGLSPPQSGTSTPKSPSVSSFIGSTPYYQPNRPYISGAEYGQYSSQPQFGYANAPSTSWNASNMSLPQDMHKR